MEDKILKHLEFVQNTINRMSTNSFIIKGWAITLVGLILGLNKLEGKYLFQNFNYNFPIEMAVILLIIILFWFTNAYFLQQERRYIYIYTKTIERFKTGNSSNLILDMNYKKYINSSSSKTIYYVIIVASILCTIISYFLFAQIVFKIIVPLICTLISLFTLSYLLPSKYLCNFWACFIGRTIISIYGIMIVLLLLINHSIFNTKSKDNIEKAKCECIVKTYNK
jgi:hypothetical protein